MSLFTATYKLWAVPVLRPVFSQHALLLFPRSLVNFLMEEATKPVLSLLVSRIGPSLNWILVKINLLPNGELYLLMCLLSDLWGQEKALIR